MMEEQVQRIAEVIQQRDEGAITDQEAWDWIANYVVKELAAIENWK